MQTNSKLVKRQIAFFMMLLSSNCAKSYNFHQKYYNYMYWYHRFWLLTTTKLRTIKIVTTLMLGLHGAIFLCAWKFHGVAMNSFDAMQQKSGKTFFSRPIKIVYLICVVSVSQDIKNMWTFFHRRWLHGKFQARAIVVATIALHAHEKIAPCSPSTRIARLKTVNWYRTCL